DEEMLSKYLDKLAKLKRKKGDKMPANFIIFDDMLAKLLANNNQVLEHLYSIHRHLSLSIIFCNQALKRTSTVLRRIINYAILFNIKDFDTLDNFYKELVNYLIRLKNLKVTF